MYPMSNNPVRHHAWGSLHDIPALLGIDPDGAPYAELWLGAYEDDSSTVEVAGEDRLLCDVLAASERLPFLAKILAIDTPLSLQLHPASGAGVKPELLYALQPCRALCGFRSSEQVKALLDDVGPLHWLRRLLTDRQDSLRYVMAELLGSSGRELVPLVSAALHRMPRWAETAGAVEELRTLHPDDPAALAPLLLEPIGLSPGDAMFCAPGQPHTYLSGFGFEVQASSAAVVRGGLTSKPVDSERFVAELDTRVGARRILPRHEEMEDVFDAGVEQFALGIMRKVDGELPRVAGPEILLCTEGSYRVADAEGSLRLDRGDSAFVPAQDGRLSAQGEGLLLRVTRGRAG